MERYSAESITVLTGLEAVRKRPAMYIGDLGPTGLHHLLWEIVGNAIDEHLRGHASYLRVKVDGDQISVEDDGRGIPIDPSPREPHTTALEIVMTMLHAGSAFRADHVHVTSGLGGVGLAVVNALCAELDAEVWRDGRRHQQRYARGVALGPVRDLGPASRTGTRITFRPDFEILEAGSWSLETIAGRLRELAAMRPALTTILGHDAVRCPDGLADHARYLGRHARSLMPGPIRIVGRRDEIAIEVALLWTAAPDACVRGFVGLSPAPRGTHLEGLEEGLLRAFVELDRGRLAGVHRAAFAEVIQRGLLAVINVMLLDPRFGNPSREQLTNPEVHEAVATLVAAELHAQLRVQPTLRELLLARLPLASVRFP